MKHINIKHFLFILIPVSGLAWFLVASFNGLNLQNMVDFLRPIPTVVTVDAFVVALFVKWWWRWRVFYGWLVPFPNLNGTWEGTLQTTWKDEHGKTPGPIPTLLTIKQSFLGLSCVMRTGEMVSYSYVEGFNLDAERQICQLCYSYTSKPNSSLRERSTPHDGTAVFNIIGSPAFKLEGEYWTQRKSTGTMSLKFKTRKMLLELPSDFPSHPMAQTE